MRKRVAVASLCSGAFAFILLATLVRNCLLGFGEEPFQSAPAIRREPAAVQPEPSRTEPAPAPAPREPQADPRGE